MLNLKLIKMLTTKKQVRDSFWSAFTEFASERRSKKKQNDYICDIRQSFCAYVESLRRDNEITEKMACNITL